MRRLAAFDRTLARLQRALGALPILEATLEQLREFTGRGLGDEAAYQEVARVQSFFRWAVREGLVPNDPTLRLERPARKPGIPRPMPRPDVERALGDAPEPLRTWFLLAARCGLRACEIAPVRTRDIVGNVLLIPEQKGGASGAVPLSPKTYAALLPYTQTQGWWFPHGTDPDRHVTAAQVSKRANRWLHEHEIPDTLHSLRHRFVTDVHRMSGYDLLLTADLARHRKLDTTRGYTLLEPNRAAAVVSAMDAA